MAKQTKIELYRAATKCGGNVSFIANVIFCHHRNPARKLAGLMALVESGHSVSLASFDIDTLQIDGAGKFSYSYLETVAQTGPRRTVNGGGELSNPTSPRVERVEYRGVEILIVSRVSRFGVLFTALNNYGEPKVSVTAFEDAAQCLAAEKTEIDSMMGKAGA